MAEVTDGDRERAVRLLVIIPESHDRVALVAAALAEERERARAPFLALASRWRESGDWIGAQVIEHVAEESA